MKPLLRPLALVLLAAATLSAPAAEAQTETTVYDRWTEIFVEGRKVGWAHEFVRLRPDRETYAFHREEHLLPDGPDGPERIIRADEIADSELRLLEMDRRIESPHGMSEAHASRTGDVVELRIETRGLEPREVEVRGGVEFTGAAEVRRLSAPLEVGREWSFLQLTPFRGTLREVTFRCVGEDPEREGVLIVEDGEPGSPPPHRLRYEANGPMLHSRDLTTHMVWRRVPDEATARDLSREAPADADPPSVVEGDRFEDPTLGLSFERPEADWTFHRDVRRGGINFAGAEDPFSDAFVFVTVLRGLPEIDLEGFRRMMVERLEEGDRSFRTLGERRVTPGGTDAVRLDGTDELGGLPVEGHVWLAVISSSGVGYMIEAWVPADLIEELGPALDRFEDSLDLTDPMESAVRIEDGRYENRFLGFALPIPESWDRTPVRGSIVFGLESPDGTRLTVESQPLRRSLPLDRLRAALVGGLENQGMEEIEAEEVEVGDGPGLHLTYERRDGSRDLAFGQLALVHRGRLLMVTVAGSPEADERPATLERIREGFERLRPR